MLSTLRPLASSVALITATVLLVVHGLEQRSILKRTPELAASARDPQPGFYVPTVNLETIAGIPVRLGESDSVSWFMAQR